MNRKQYSRLRPIYVQWCQLERKMIKWTLENNLPYDGRRYLLVAQSRLVNIRKRYYRRKRRMIVIRNTIMLFCLAVAISIMMSGCAAIAGASIAMSKDPIDVQAQRDACDNGISEMDEHYHKTQTGVKHTAKTVCK